MDREFVLFLAAQECSSSSLKFSESSEKTENRTSSNGQWKSLRINFAGPFNGKMLLVVVDAFSKFLDVVPMDHATCATTIKVLRPVFSVFGLPEHTVTDIGSQFSSHVFKNWLAQNDIHTLTAPRHSATNGLVWCGTPDFSNRK